MKRIDRICSHVNATPTLAQPNPVFRRVLIANRGEIAIRIAKAAFGLGIQSVAVYSSEDATCLHTRAASEAHEIGKPGENIAPYLSIPALIKVAKDTGCDCVHPGYGFLSENPDFAAACEAEGLKFIGPPVAALNVFGNKVQARQLAESAGVRTVPGTPTCNTWQDAAAAIEANEIQFPVMLKASFGGGGRGMRVVTSKTDLQEAFERCSSEALTSFGDDSVFVEKFIRSPRHIEVQILADSTGSVVHLYERDCSVQLRNQKMIEIAPAPGLADMVSVRAALHADAIKLCSAAGYVCAGTVEFLLDPASGDFYFIECNPRIQVEHTVTEQVTSVDLVETQFLLAAGRSLQSLGLSQQEVVCRGFSIQARVVATGAGTMAAYKEPSGVGVRVDGCGYPGYSPSLMFDPMFAKVVVSHHSSFQLAVLRLCQFLNEFLIVGLPTNLSSLRAIAASSQFQSGDARTTLLVEFPELLTGDASAPSDSSMLGFLHKSAAAYAGKLANDAAVSSKGAAANSGLAGTQVGSTDPLALFGFRDYNAEREGTGRQFDDWKPSFKALQFGTPAATQQVGVVGAIGESDGPEGTVGVMSPIQGKVFKLEVTAGDVVRRGQTVAVLEAMKMEHELRATVAGTVAAVTMDVGDVVREGFPLVFIREDSSVGSNDGMDMDSRNVNMDHIRPDLQLIVERHNNGFDEFRPSAVKRRQRFGQRTARNNIDDMCDRGSFVEYGPLVIARQRRRRQEDDLRKNTPADGIICGTGRVNGDLFGDVRSRVLCLAYDYTVLAGTQGGAGHYKQDRMFVLARRFRLPVVFFTEGGGGRPGDTDAGPGGGPVGMDCGTFSEFATLSGLVPLVGITSGRCFAGNTALLACCDVIIATENSTVAMGGPAMIEGGGLGVYTPEEVGPLSFQVPNGVVDIVVANEAEATIVAKKYLSYFQGALRHWEVPDQRALRQIVPESRTKMYDMREVIATLCDKESVLEIRPEFGVGIITCLVRIEGKPCGLIANNPHHLAGAIDSPGSDKAARFLQLCDAFDLPVISVIDCPGMMVGPEVEATGLVRHCARLFNTGANLSVPLFALIVRKAYGLGVQAMMGGSSLMPLQCATWPTGEFSGMGIEGAVKLGQRAELESIKDPDERLSAYNKLVEAAYDRAKAANAAEHFGVDDVIDPADSRYWISNGLRSLPPENEPAGWINRPGKRRPYIDTW